MKTFEQNGLWTFMPVSAQVAPIKCVKSLACNLHSLGVAHYPYQSKGSSIATPFALVLPLLWYGQQDMTSSLREAQVAP